RRRHPRRLRRGQGRRLRSQDHAPDRAPAQNEAGRPGRNGSDPRDLQGGARPRLTERGALPLIAPATTALQDWPMTERAAPPSASGPIPEVEKAHIEE